MNIDIRMMKVCSKCGVEHDKQGLYCSRKCANSRTWSEEDKLKKSESARNSEKVNRANKLQRNHPKSDVKTICLVCGEFIYHKKYNPKKYHSDCWRKVAGGLRQGSGRGKKSWHESKIAGRVFLDN